jgi:hypothetical protein
VNLYCEYCARLYVSALCVGHLQVYIREGVHYTLATPVRDLVLRIIELRWCLGYSDRGGGTIIINWDLLAAWSCVFLILFYMGVKLGR